MERPSPPSKRWLHLNRAALCAGQKKARARRNPVKPDSTLPLSAATRREASARKTQAPYGGFLRGEYSNMDNPARTPRVLNKRDIKGALPPTAKYCGRPSPLGNPFVIGKDGTRDEVIAKHAAWVKTQPQLLPLIKALRGFDLVCFCAPAPCHCDLYLKMANEPESG